MLWTCAVCRAAYSVGAPRCPQCGSSDRIDRGGHMPKITAHGGPTAEGTEPEGGEQSSPGSSSSTSSEKPAHGGKSSDPDRPKRARTAGSRSTRHPEGESTAGSTGGGGRKTPSSDN